MAEKIFTASHEWYMKEGDVATVGISKYTQKELGEVVYLELPKVGQEVKVDEEVVILESTKAATDIPSPLGGRVIEINEPLLKDPRLVNQDPEGAGWLYKLNTIESSKS